MRASVNIKECDINKLLRKVVVLVDTREKENLHITSFFDSKGIAWRLKALETVDYSCELPADESLGLPFPISLEREIGIERKNSLTEIAGNFGKGRHTFEEKWQRAKETTQDIYLLIESGCWADIENQRYRSEMGYKAFYNSLISWRTKYGFHIDFVPQSLSAQHILRLLQDKLKKILQE